jgi:poly(A) polymerase
MTPAFPWLEWPALASLLDVLGQDGEEARVVGGAVRNSLLGEPVSEWDIATTATPDLVSARARRAGWRVVPTGIEHGTVTVIVSGQPFEVTTLREDVKTDGRRAVVRFGRDFEADALRRDFTINALSVGRDGIIHDYAGGLKDLERRLVRFIGDPDRRIAEDYLRILRFFRFHARYGLGPMDAAGFAAAIRGRNGLSKLSRERIRAEVMRLLVAPRAPAVCEAMEGAGLFLRILGGVTRSLVLGRLAAMETELSLTPDPLRRLAALGLWIIEDAKRLSERLRLSRAEGRRLERLAASGESVTDEPTAREVRALIYRIGAESVRDVMLVGAARRGVAPWTSALAEPARWQPPRPPFGGEDAGRLGIAAGPKVGRLLAEAERRWIELDFPADDASHAAILSAARASLG